jgi:hypothetical protein
VDPFPLFVVGDLVDPFPLFVVGDLVDAFPEDAFPPEEELFVVGDLEDLEDLRSRL